MAQQYSEEDGGPGQCGISGKHMEDAEPGKFHVKNKK
jgi:hypothetical protein